MSEILANSELIEWYVAALKSILTFISKLAIGLECILFGAEFFREAYSL
jgi:hypothetical protein